MHWQYTHLEYNLVMFKSCTSWDTLTRLRFSHACKRIWLLCTTWQKHQFAKCRMCVCVWSLPNSSVQNWDVISVQVFLLSAPTLGLWWSCWWERESKKSSLKDCCQITHIQVTFVHVSPCRCLEWMCVLTYEYVHFRIQDRRTPMVYADN